MEDAKETMLDGLAIVLQRLETHPEEFFGSTKWSKFLDYDEFGIFTEEEAIEVAKAKIKIQEYAKEQMRKQYTENVLEQLARGSDPRDYKRVKYEEMQGILKQGVASLDSNFEYQWLSEKK